MSADGYCTPENSDIDPELWFSDTPADYLYAKSLCRTRCQIQSSCLEGAISRREQHGVWGGVKFGRDKADKLRREEAS